MSKVEKKKKRINKILSIGKGGKVEEKRRNETETIGACSFFLRLLLGRGCVQKLYIFIARLSSFFFFFLHVPFFFWDASFLTPFNSGLYRGGDESEAKREGGRREVKCCAKHFCGGGTRGGGLLFCLSFHTRTHSCLNPLLLLLLLLRCPLSKEKGLDLKRPPTSPLFADACFA